MPQGIARCVRTAETVLDLESEAQHVPNFSVSKFDTPARCGAVIAAISCGLRRPPANYEVPVEQS